MTGLVIGTTIILARRLGAAATGQYFLFLRVVALLAAFCDLGFSQSVNVFAARGESVRQVHGVMLRMATAASAVLLLVFVVVVWSAGDRVLPNFPLPLRVATIVALPCFVYSTFWTYLMIGLGEIWRLNIVQVSTAALTLVLVLCIIVGLSFGLTAAVAIYTGTLVLQVIVMMTVVHLLGKATGLEPRAGLFGDMWRFGLRASGGAVAAMIWPRIPVFVLNVWYGPAAVGVFSVAQQLVEKALLPIQATQEAIYRRMARLSRADAPAAMNRYIRIGAWLMMAVLLVAVVVLPAAVTVILGPEYAGAALTMAVLVPGAVVMSVSLLLATYFLAQLARPGLLSLLALGNVALNLVLSLALIPHLGAVGAAGAVALTQIAGTAIVVILYIRATGSKPLDLIRITKDDRETVRRQVGELFVRSSG